MFIIFILIGAVCGVELSDTKISTTRSTYRTTVCDYYNTNFTDTQKSQTQTIIDSYSYLTDAQIEKMLFSYDFSAPST